MNSSAPGHSRRQDAVIEKAAADWLARRDRGFTPEESAAFADWASVDPRHQAEFSRLTSTWNALDTADEIPRIMALSYEVDANLERRAGRRRSRPWLLGLAAAIALGWALWKPGPVSPSLENALAANTCRIIPSSARQLPLPDGSMVELNADALVEPVFSAGERRVRLVRGEAHFTVAKDSNRPFVVEVGSVALCAVGTVFNVRLERAAVQLLVTEGKVRVDPVTAAVATAEIPATPAVPLVTAGQRLVVASDESGTRYADLRPETIAPEELARSLAWKQSQLIFDRTPLAAAIAVFNRFNKHQLVVDDPRLAARKLGGTFQTNNIEGFVHLLETGFDVTADRRSEGQTILRGRE